MKKFMFIIVVMALAFCASGSASGQTCASGITQSALITRETKAAVIDSVLRAVNDRYVYPERAADIARYIRDRFNDDKYDAITMSDKFTEALTTDLRAFSKDFHFGIRSRISGCQAAPCVAVGNDVEALKKINFGFRTVSFLPGNVGYLELTHCTPASLGASTAIATMEYLSSADALIIDLRTNGGGVTSMGLLIAGYFFDSPKTMHSIRRRDARKSERFITDARANAGKLHDIPIYILTSKQTVSSAESFAYDLKHHGRATIVGERTLGAAHCAEIELFNFSDFQLEVMVPSYEPIHPVTGSNWEGTGVVPDIEIPAIDALPAAHRTALERLGNKSVTPVKTVTPETETRSLFHAAGTPILEKTAVGEILSLYEQYDIVHIGERHWNMTDYDFRTSLVKHPAFAEIVDDIVIESGNYLYQDILDEYVLELKDVSEQELRKVWRNHVVPTGVWDAPIYRDFIKTVREVNERLPAEKRVRVIAAEPPIDWSNVKTWEEMAPFFAARSTHTPKVVLLEVLNKKRKALMIYGGGHFYRSSNLINMPGRLLANLEDVMAGKIFTILPLSGDDDFSRTFQKESAADHYPFFVNLKTSNLAGLRGHLFFGEAAGTLGEFTDGILYFGTDPDRVAESDPAATGDTAYQNELKRRQALLEAGTAR